jgi:hypothetical protein
VTEKQSGVSPHFFRLLGIAAFIAVFITHVLYLRYLTGESQKGWADSFNSSPTFWRSYLSNQDYFVSFSYALSASFAIWAAARFAYFRRRSAAIGAMGGVSILTLLATAGCFLIGCCGSPMLPIYVSLFGSKAAGVGKPLMALISLISIGAGYLYILRRPECNCTDPTICSSSQKSGSVSAKQPTSSVRTH